MLHFLLKPQQRCVTKEVPRLTTLETMRCKYLSDEDLSKAVDREKDLLDAMPLAWYPS